MRAARQWLVVTVVCCASSTALADDHPPAIPIRDLPEFPIVQQDQLGQSEVGVYGASVAEEETVVGAAKREQSLGTVASAVTVVTSDTIRRFGYRTLAEALRSVADVYVTDDRAIERVGVRGVGILGDENTRILILIDGTPLNEPWAQFVDGSTALPVSMDDVARIEVIRGPVSSIYGTNAFVGIINIVTLEADKAPRAYGRTTMDSYGTFGGNAAFNQGDINKQIRGTVSYNYRAGETVSDFPMPAASTSADGAHALLGSVALNYGRLFAQVRGTDRLRELPGAPFNAQIGSSDNRNADTQVTGEVGYNREVARGITVAGRLYGNRYTFDNHLVYGSTTPDFETHATSIWYGGELRVLGDFIELADQKTKLLSITTGANIEQTLTTSTSSTPLESFDHNGCQAATSDTCNFSIAGAYFEGTATPKPWFAITGGARYDRNSLFTNKLSPRAAAFLRKGDDYGVKLLYAQGFRNPSIFEAYYDDGSRFYPALDPDQHTELEPETITATELVAYGKPATGVKLRVSAWNWEMKHLLERSAINAGPNSEVRLEYRNNGLLVSRGAEVESSYRDVAGRYAYANLAVSLTAQNCVAKDASGNTLDGLLNNPLLDKKKGNCDASQNAPVVVAKVGASTQELMNLFYVSAEAQYISKRGTQDPTAPVPAWWGLNLVWYAPDVKGFDVTVGARNLIMREEVPAQSDYNRGSGSTAMPVLEVPGPGREVFARVGYRF